MNVIGVKPTDPYSAILAETYLEDGPNYLADYSWAFETARIIETTGTLESTNTAIVQAATERLKPDESSIEHLALSAMLARARERALRRVEDVDINVPALKGSSLSYLFTRIKYAFDLNTKRSSIRQEQLACRIITHNLLVEAHILKFGKDPLSLSELFGVY